MSRRLIVLLATVCTCITIALYFSLNRQSMNRYKAENMKMVNIGGVFYYDNPTTDFQSIYANFSPLPVDIEVNGHVVKFNTETPIRKPTKLRMHVVFHSHVDPGWLKTFEDYYTSKVKNIMSNAVKALNSYEHMRFIWSETSFLERWYRDATEEEKNSLKKHVDSGRLEITGGAWVMTDEATPLFYSAIENMIEGHQFIYNTLKVRPNTSWSVDPFGHGAMMPHLLTKAGVGHMVIGRFHDHVKQHLRERQSLRWQWNELYTQDPSTGPRVNSLPYFVYSTENACPNNKVCKCYHVEQSSLAACRGVKLSSRMTYKNLEKAAKVYMGEMLEVQKLYGTTDHLVAVGDDFYFSNMDDFHEMYNGFRFMSEYYKYHPELNVEMRFSTVSEFFDSIKHEKLPSFRGDLFPYTSDRHKPNPWWTGYFTHRPVSKRIERVLQAALRGMDLLLHLENNKDFNYTDLRESKRNLALFQHHDGITGTSKVHVMKDYETRMTTAYKNYMFNMEKLFQKNNLHIIAVQPNNLHERIELNGKTSVYIVIYNSNTFPFSDVITISVDTAVVVSHADQQLVTQCHTINDTTVLVSWVASLPAMSTTTFQLENKTPATDKMVDKLLEIDGENKTNFNIGGQKKPIAISFYSIPDTGGAYTFEPTGAGTKIEVQEVTEEIGPILHRRTFTFVDSKLIVWITTSSNCSDGIDIQCQTDITDDHSLMMHIDTDINSHDFHTDINGLFHVRRTYQQVMDNKPLPYESNFYPVAASAFIQDQQWRMTVISGQPLSASSGDTKGSFHFLMDRRQTGSDGKGLLYNDAFDKRSALVKYKILFEERLNDSSSVSPSLSYEARKHWHNELYPPVLLSSDQEDIDRVYLTYDWPCNIQLVSWRPISQTQSLIILRKIVFDASIPTKRPCNPSMKDVLDMLKQRFSSIQHTSLTGTDDKQQQVTVESLQESLEKPYEIVALKMTK